MMGRYVELNPDDDRWLLQNVVRKSQDGAICKRGIKSTGKATTINHNRRLLGHSTMANSLAQSWRICRI
jgi:hypothetical protein